MRLEYIVEGQNITLYHGDSKYIKKVPADNHVNYNAEGVGIHFTPNLDFATRYGDNIVVCITKKKYFVDSIKELKEVKKIAAEIIKIDNYEKYTNPNFPPLEETIREFQMNYLNIHGFRDFQKMWKKVFKGYIGLYSSDLDEYIICVDNINFKMLNDN